VKRIFAAAVGILVPLLVAPGLALAQDGSGLGPPEGPEIGGVGGSVGGIGGVGGSVGGVGGSAFTGAEIAGLVAFAIALVVIGVVLLALTRRRRAVRHEA
jgi:hypothetical protein